MTPAERAMLIEIARGISLLGANVRGVDRAIAAVEAEATPEQPGVDWEEVSRLLGVEKKPQMNLEAEAMPPSGLNLRMPLPEFKPEGGMIMPSCCCNIRVGEAAPPSEPPLCDAGNMIVTCLGSLIVDGEPTTLPPGTRVTWQPVKMSPPSQPEKSCDNCQRRLERVRACVDANCVGMLSDYRGWQPRQPDPCPTCEGTGGRDGWLCPDCEGAGRVK